MISVIVPVYNCEKYLDKSIQSLINQTIFDDLEIIFAVSYTHLTLPTT